MNKSFQNKRDEKNLLMVDLYIALLQRISDLGDRTTLDSFLEIFLRELSDNAYLLHNHNLDSEKWFEDLRRKILATLKVMQSEKKGWINCYYESNKKEYNPCEVDFEGDDDFSHSKKLEITITGKKKLQKIALRDRISVERIFYILVSSVQQFESIKANKSPRKLQGSHLTNEEQEELARKRILESIKSRQGQQKFRNDLIRNYEHCLVTKCKLIDLLEAAHIRPYSENGTFKISNGLLLRADIHTLFDLNLISIDSITMKVLIKPEIKFTEYVCYENQALLFPMSTSHRPDKEALDEHRHQAGL